ncbi:hypothetical protein [Embleya sp. NBC_00896]|uniref:hypothetical protein n=1 Tax=Embleya sp. NBC_00896 TaxID=2975961 RepID=UPI003863282B|nr:hypothetical protein OG928_25580 [Embleya sp. NBC_00896]
MTEMTKQRVTEVAKVLVERSGIDLDQVPNQAQELPQYVQQVAEELYETGKANRDLLVGIVRGEVDKALSRSKPWTKDLIRAEEEITRLKGRVTDLEHRLARASTPRVPRTPVPVAAEEAPAPVAKPAAKPVAKKAAAKKTAAKKTADKPPVPSATVADNAAAPPAGPRKPARKTNGTAAKKSTPAKKATHKPAAEPDDAS